MAPVSSCHTSDLRRGNIEQQADLRVTSSGGHDQEQEVWVDIIDYDSTSLDPPNTPPDVLHLLGLFNSRPEVW